MSAISLKWLERHLRAAEHRATYSKDPSTQVGAVLVAPDGKEDHTYGYNGYPKGVNDVGLTDRDYKYPRTVHAELNAIIKSKRDLTGHYIFCTLAPCAGCAAAIIQSGIRYVYHVQENFEKNDRWIDSHLTALDMFEEAGVFCNGVYLEKSALDMVSIPQQRLMITERKFL